MKNFKSVSKLVVELLSFQFYRNPLHRLWGRKGSTWGSVGANKGPIPFIIIYHISQKGLQQKSKDFEKKKFFVLRSDPKMFQACNKTMGSSTRVRTKTISEFINLLK